MNIEKSFYKKLYKKKINIDNLFYEILIKKYRFSYDFFHNLFYKYKIDECRLKKNYRNIIIFTYHEEKIIDLFIDYYGIDNSCLLVNLEYNYYKKLVKKCKDENIILNFKIICLCFERLRDKNIDSLLIYYKDDIKNIIKENNKILYIRKKYRRIFKKLYKIKYV